MYRQYSAEEGASYSVQVILSPEGASYSVHLILRPAGGQLLCMGDTRARRGPTIRYM